MSADAIGIVLRHEVARVTAALLREFGAARLASIEDALAQAMLEATVAWRSRGVPSHARAWLHRAARHRMIDELRRSARVGELPPQTEPAVQAEPEPPSLCDDVKDDELRALFLCAHPSVPIASQLVFALRTLSGFSTREVAVRLFTSPQNVQKRYERARDALRGVDVRAEPCGDALAARLDGVHRMIYVLFTEGYFASSGSVLRLELCREAIRLAEQLAAHPRASTPAAWALLALMRFHHARADARVDERGDPVPLEQQDRTRYRRDELALAIETFARAAEGGLASKYHLEAAIAAEHALAPTFDDIRWPLVVGLYQRLEAVDPSPLHALHGAIALSYAEDPRAGLARLDALRPPTWLAGSHLWLATRADFHARLGQEDQARNFYEQAMALAPPNERRALRARMCARLG